MTKSVKMLFVIVVILIFMNSCMTTNKSVDIVLPVTTLSSIDTLQKMELFNAVIFLVSFHHNNTEKVAKEIAFFLNAKIITFQDFHNTESIENCKLIGFGSGIYDQKHHQTILDLVDKLTFSENQKVFIFSTSGISREQVVKISEDPHCVLREKLESKGCVVVDEFNCVGWNTNSFLKYFGGINKKHPNDKDLSNARIFAEKLNNFIE